MAEPRAAEAHVPAYKRVRTADLIPYARNARTHSDAQVQAIAKSAGVDWSKVEAKIKDGSIDQNLGTNRALAEAMSISGTPGFIIGDQILRGAPRDLASLKAIVKDVRAGKSIQ